MLRSSLLAPPARSYENRIVIRPMGESWDDIGHQTCVNQELGMFCHLLCPGMVIIGGRRVAAWS
jgi:hypothetical protein